MTLHIRNALIFFWPYNPFSTYIPKKVGHNEEDCEFSVFDLNDFYLKLRSIIMFLTRSFFCSCFLMVIFTTLFRRCSTFRISTLLMTTLFRRSNQHCLIPTLSKSRRHINLTTTLKCLLHTYILHVFVKVVLNKNISD